MHKKHPLAWRKVITVPREHTSARLSSGKMSQSANETTHMFQEAHLGSLRLQSAHVPLSLASCRSSFALACCCCLVCVGLDMAEIVPALIRSCTRSAVRRRETRCDAVWLI